MRQIIGYGIVNGVKVNCVAYQLEVNRLNQNIPNSPIKIRTQDNEWVTIDEQQLFLYKK